MSTPTEAHRHLAATILLAHARNKYPFESAASAAQLIADSEARAVADLQDQLKAETARADAGWAERDQLRAEVAQRREREKLCAAMDEAAKLALIRALQEIRDAIGVQGGDTLSPHQIVEAVRKQSAEVERQTKRANECAEIALAYAPKYEQAVARAEKAEARAGEVAQAHNRELLRADGAEAELALKNAALRNAVLEGNSLRAELAKERARLDWLDAQAKPETYEDDTHATSWSILTEPGKNIDVRAAIDAAMEEGAT